VKVSGTLQGFFKTINQIKTMQANISTLRNLTAINDNKFDNAVSNVFTFNNNPDGRKAAAAFQTAIDKYNSLNQSENGDLNLYQNHVEMVVDAAHALIKEVKNPLNDETDLDNYFNVCRQFRKLKERDFLGWISILWTELNYLDDKLHRKEQWSYPDIGDGDIDDFI
jgi:hypothetical protein